MGRYLVTLVLALSALLIPARMDAQQGTSQISGKVTDAQGAVLPGVSVVVKNEETGATRELTSSAEGTYVAAQLMPGKYSVSGRLTGFRAIDRNGLTLLVGTTLTINLTLAGGGVAEAVPGTGRAPVV